MSSRIHLKCLGLYPRQLDFFENFDQNHDFGLVSHILNRYTENISKQGVKNTNSMPAVNRHPGCKLVELKPYHINNDHNEYSEIKNFGITN